MFGGHREGAQVQGEWEESARRVREGRSWTVLGPPQGFVFGAILSIRRRAHMQCFLNSLFMADHNDNAHGSWVQTFPYSLDLHCTDNFSTWAACRDCVLLFGEGYKQRTDANGGLMVLYLAFATIALILFTTVNGEKLYYKDYLFPAVVHFMLVATLATFSILLALEGHSCNEITLRSKTVLSCAMLRLESSEAATSKDSPEARWYMSTARFAAAQLHETLAASKNIHGMSVLGMIDLDKSLVFTVFFAAFTQLTLVLENLTTIEPEQQ